jgi:hypothetical protein
MSVRTELAAWTKYWDRFIETTNKSVGQIWTYVHAEASRVDDVKVSIRNIIDVQRAVLVDVQKLRRDVDHLYDTRYKERDLRNGSECCTQLNVHGQVQDTPPSGLEPGGYCRG